MTEETKKIHLTNEMCFICKHLSLSRDLVQCEVCPLKAHIICLFIEKTLSKPENLVDGFFWYKFSAYSIPFQKLWMISEDLFLEECEELRNKFNEILLPFKQNSNINIEENNLIETLKEIQKTICDFEVKIPNRGFKCQQHGTGEFCICANRNFDDNNDIFCEYCNRWFHLECLGIDHEPDLYICDKCGISQIMIPELLELFERKDLNDINKLQGLIDKINNNYVRYLDIIILGSIFSDFLMNLEQNGLGIECYIKVLSEFAMKIPLNLEYRLMNATQNYLKNCYWDNYLMEKNLIIPQIVSSCLENHNEGIEFNEKANKELQEFILNLRALEQDVRSDELNKKHRKLDDLENIWKAQKIVKKIMRGQEIISEKFEFLKEQMELFPELTDFKIAVDYNLEKRALMKELEIFNEIINEQKTAREILTNDQNQSIDKENKEMWEADFFKMGKFSENEAEKVLEKLRSYRKFVRETESWENIDAFCLKIQDDMRKLESIKLDFEKSYEKAEDFEDFGLKLYKLRVWTQESLVLFEKWLKWKKWSKNLRIFNKVRSELCLFGYIWQNGENSDFQIDNPLLCLSQNINLSIEPQISNFNVSLFKVLALESIQELLNEGIEIQKNGLPFLENQLSILRNLVNESLGIQNILQKIYQENVSDNLFELLMIKLRNLNVFLPIFRKIWKFAQKPKEISLLVTPKESFFQIIKKLEIFMFKKISLLSLTELLKAKKLAKRFKRLINSNKGENVRPWIIFTNEIVDNFKLFQQISFLLIDEKDQISNDNELNVSFLQEKLEFLITNYQEEIEKKPCFFNPDLNKMIEESLSNENSSNLLIKLDKFHEIDTNPELKIILKGFPEVLFEFRWLFWILKISKASIDSILSLEDFLECQIYLHNYIEKLGVPLFQYRKQYEAFKDLEKKVEDWMKDYEYIIRFLLEDQSTIKGKLEEFHKKLGLLIQKMPIKIKCCENQLNNLFVAFEAALKAKKTLSLMNFEKKELAFCCIETLYEFFKDQSSKDYKILEFIPFSQELIMKYLDLKNLKLKINEIQSFLKKKNRTFKHLVLKMADAKAIRFRDPSISTIYLMNQKSFFVNPEGIYDNYNEIMDYQDLRDLIESSKHSGIDLNAERLFLQEIKQNTESIMISLESMRKINPCPEVSHVFTKENVDHYFFAILSQRNHLFSKNLIQCESFQMLRIYEWVIYVLCTFNGHFWLLDENTDSNEIKENFQTLMSLDLNFDEIPSIKPLNEFIKMQKLLDEGNKNKEIKSFSKENMEVLELLRNQIQAYEVWKQECFEVYKQKYEKLVENLCKIKECTSSEPCLLEDLKILIKTLFSGRIFEKDSLEFIATQVLEFEHTKSFWFGLKNLKILQGITESMIRGLFWLKDFTKIGFFNELITVLQQIKQRFHRFSKKRTQKRFSRLFRIYKASGLIVPEIEKLREDHNKSLLFLDQMYFELQEDLKMGGCVELWAKLSNLKKRLNDETQWKFQMKYQTFRLEILENQILCLKSLDSQKIKGKKKINGHLEDLMKSNTNGEESENNMKKYENMEENGKINEELQNKIIMIIAELEEIKKESQFLSKPSRDFLANFLKKYKKNPLIIMQKYIWFANLSTDNELMKEKETTPRKINLIEFKRIRALYRLKGGLEKGKGVFNKKTNHLAEYLENRMFGNHNKYEYEWKVEELLEKISGVESRDIWKVLDVKIQKKDEDVIEKLKKEFEIFIRD